MTKIIQTFKSLAKVYKEIFILLKRELTWHDIGTFLKFAFHWDVAAYFSGGMGLYFIFMSGNPPLMGSIIVLSSMTVLGVYHLVLRATKRWRF